MSRWVSWLVAMAALSLIVVSVGSYFYHRRQMDSIAARYLRLVVAGPGQMQAGMPSVYNLMTTTVTGEPWAAPVEWSLSTPDGKRLVDRKEATDGQGRLTMIVPADMDLPTRSHGPAQLAVTADGMANPPSVSLPLPIRPAQYLTRLWLDRRRYRPGDAVYYRSLTVSRCSLVACATLPVQFEILDPKLVPLPGSRIEGLTDHGVGNGSFRLSDAQPVGAYTLVSRCIDGAFPEERLTFEVLDAATPNPQLASGTRSSPSPTRPPQIDFYPEGGQLAAGVENRVYFSARDENGQPLAIRGNILDGKGTSVTRVESNRGGLGVFRFVPRAAETYRLGVARPAGFSPPPVLPSASADQKIAITTERGVFAPGTPIELNIRARKDPLPLVIAARVRGMLVGMQMLVTSADPQAGGDVVSIPLDDRAAGLIRVTVYDCTKSPPKVLAERLVYRRPSRLTIRAAEERKAADEVLLTVQDEKGLPVAAALALEAFEEGKDKSSQASRCGPDLLRAFFVDGDLQNPAMLAGTDLRLSDADAQAAALDLVLGCQGPLAEGRPRGPQHSKVATDPSPLALFDNLDELRAQYEATLSEYRAKRTHVVNALIMLSFFGGLALALLVTMLALLRIVWGSRLWLPTIVAMVCCVVVTSVSNEPSRMKPVEATAVQFTPCLPHLDKESKEEDHGESAGGESKPADNKLRSLAEKLGKRDADPEGLKPDRFVVRQYPPPDTAGSSEGGEGVKPLAWYPLLIAGPDGRVTVPAVKPAAGRSIRLIIDAQSDGRIESCDLLLTNPDGQNR